MSSKLAFVLLFCLCGTSLARPTFEAYFGLNELRSAAVISPAEDGKQDHMQNFRHVDPNSGRFIELKYHARVVSGIISLDEIKTVDAVECSEEGLTLTFLNQNDAISFFNENSGDHALISGGYEWGCNGIILRKQVKKAVVQGSRIFISTENANHAHFIEKGTFSFSTNLYTRTTNLPVAQFSNPQSTFVSRESATEDEGFESFFSDVWGEADTLGDQIQSVVSSVTNIVEIATSGDFNVTYSDTLPVLNINYNSDTKSASQSLPITPDGLVSCYNCYGELDLIVATDFDIQDFSFQSFSCSATGQIGVNIAAQAKASYSKSFSNNLSLGTISLPSIPLTIGGVPFLIQTDVPMNVGASGSFDAVGSIGAHAAFSGSISFGVTATPEGTYTSKSHSFTYGGKFDALQDSVTAEMEVYFLPTIVVTIDKIGGPNFGLKGFIEATATASTNPSQPCHNKGGLSASLSWGAQITVGAMISIEIEGKQIYGPKQITARTLYSTQRPIASGCVVFPFKRQDSNETFTIDSTILVPGMTWAGLNNVTCSPACNSYCNQSNLIVSYQYIGNASVNGQLYDIAIGSYAGIFDEDGSCTIQLAYTMTYDNSTSQLTFNPITTDDGYALGYAACEYSNETLQANAATGVISADLSTLTFGSSDGCSSAVLVNYSGDYDEESSE